MCCRMHRNYGSGVEAEMQPYDLKGVEDFERVLIIEVFFYETIYNSVSANVICELTFLFSLSIVTSKWPRSISGRQ